MDSDQKDLYYVAVKLFLRDGPKLLITHDIFGAWDLPGGRLRINEFEKPLEAVLARKINEELGPKVKYQLGAPVTTFRVERFEHTLGERVRIFALGYEAEYLEGTVILGPYHDQMEWVPVATFDPKRYFEGGWLKGVEEYLSLLRNNDEAQS